MKYDIYGCSGWRYILVIKKNELDKEKEKENNDVTDIRYQKNYKILSCLYNLYYLTFFKIYIWNLHNVFHV